MPKNEAVKKNVKKTKAKEPAAKADTAIGPSASQQALDSIKKKPSIFRKFLPLAVLLTLLVLLVVALAHSTPSQNVPPAAQAPSDNPESVLASDTTTNGGQGSVFMTGASSPTPQPASSNTLSQATTQPVQAASSTVLFPPNSLTPQTSTQYPNSTQPGAEQIPPIHEDSTGSSPTPAPHNNQTATTIDVHTSLLGLGVKISLQAL